MNSSFQVFENDFKRIREMTVDDNIAVVDLAMRTWQKDYKGIIDDEFLDHFPRENFLKGREFILKKEKTRCCVALDQTGSIVGFSDAGKSFESPPDDCEAEVYAIYIDPAHQRCGIGKKLFEDQLFNLKKAGYQRVIVWTLEENKKSRLFYEKLGGALKGKKDKEIGQKMYSSVRYEWDLQN